ncbi:MAG: BspA family leucine-rich repeat surface protein [Prevotella sp.]|nr:BspA family leucine-rich repeat surface protein [Prevotella sp.]
METNLTNFNRWGKLFLALLAMMLSTPLLADQGYATFDSTTGTLTFRYGIPTGTLNVDYYDTDNTPINSEPKWYSLRQQTTSVVFDPSFADARPKRCCRWFMNFSALTTITGIEYLNTSNVTAMNQMFAGCSSLTALDLSHLNTNNVTTMFSMFYNCSLLASLDVRNFNTSNVTNMAQMFQGCSKLTTLDVSHFDTGKVTTMNSMFRSCGSLTAIDVSSFDTSNVTNIAGMFMASGFTTLDLGNFDTSSVTDMQQMFYQCGNLTAVNLSSFDTRNVTNMRFMFSSCRKLQSLDLSRFDTGNVLNMEYMFTYNNALSALDISGFNTSKVTTMANMFLDCSSLSALDVSSFDTSNVTTMNQMFCGCSNVVELDVSNFDTSNVTDMGSMFKRCHKLANVDVRSFDTGKVTKFNEMFRDCSVLKSITFGSKFSRSSASVESDVLYGSNSLRYIDFFDVEDTEVVTSVERATAHTFFASVPATTVIYLPAGSNAVTDVSNVVYSHNGDASDLRCPSYYSEDKSAVELPRSFKANEAVYTRKMKAATQYGTVVLPYQFVSNESVQAYTLSDEHTETMFFVEAASVPAHTPFFYAKKTSSAVLADFTTTDGSGGFGITVNTTHPTSAAEGGSPYIGSTGKDSWSTKGFYITEEIDVTNEPINTFYITGDKFVMATGTLKMNPHRATFQGRWERGGSSVEAPTLFSIDIQSATDDDLPTEIKQALDAAELQRLQPQSVCDAQGRRLATMRPGLNIVRMADGSVRKLFVR